MQTFTGYDDGDIDCNGTASPTMHDLLAQRYSRRATLRSGVSAMTAAVFGGMVLAACDEDQFASPGTNITVTAGGAAATTAGKQVTLTGATTGGNVNGWTQLSGPVVSLANAGGPVATFSAPGVATATALTFQFAATGGAGSTGTTQAATTTITVNPAQLDYPAVAKSLADQVIVPAGYTVTVLYRTGDPINANAGAMPTTAPTRASPIAPATTMTE